MILAVAATEFEMAAYLQADGGNVSRTLVCGVGAVESCLQLTRYLERHQGLITVVMNFGVGGAYPGSYDKTPELLDLCLAEKETFGDLGICFPRRIDELSDGLALRKHFNLDAKLLSRAKDIFKEHGYSYYLGNFITVNCVSGTQDRGELLRRKYDGLCENMEGAGVARVCREFSLPLLQLRCISNYVEDRDPQRWLLSEASEKIGKIAALTARELGKNDG